MQLKMLALVLLFAGAGMGEAAAQRADGFDAGLAVRTRAEVWNWFDAGPEGEYAYLGSIARGAAWWRRGAVMIRGDLAAPFLAGLPDDAVQPPPAGALGLGASYAAANDGDEHPAGLFVKQLWVQAGGPRGHRLRAGRTEFADGSELQPADPSVAALKRDRIAHRLIGTFGWSHVGRSFDGLLYSYGAPRLDFTAMLAQPTRGAFDVEAGGRLDEVTFAYAALSGAASARTDARVFGIYYRDNRGTLAADNRPLPVRQSDFGDLEIASAGAHLVHLFPTAAGPVDLLLWGTYQTGSWQALDHRAMAGAAELGIQPRSVPLRPWLRVGYDVASGDPDPGDARHETFMPMLPTPRIYARPAFYTAMNRQDLFASLILRPTARATIRGDVRELSLTASEDLWYAGGGPFEEETFGFAGRPSGGASSLATLLDVSVELRPAAWATITGYASRAIGGEVPEGIYGPDANLTFGYVEVELRAGALR